MVNYYMQNARNRLSGARYSQDERMKDGVYDCSSFVGRTLNSSGLGIRPDITTADMNPDKKNAMSKAGFVWHEGLDGLQEGDVLWREGHTEFSAGNGRTLGAHSTKSGVSERPMYGSYRGYWRYAGNDAAPVAPTEGTTNPNTVRPSVEPQGFVDPMVAQSVQRQMPVPSTPARQGFVGSVNIPDFSRSLLATVQRNNAELADMTSGMGFANMRPNLSLG